MFRNTIIAIAALGLAGAATVSQSAPAEAFFLCIEGTKHADSQQCRDRAARQAERRAKWQAFWGGLFKGHDRKRG